MVGELRNLLKRELEVCLIKEADLDRLIDKYVNQNKLAEDLETISPTEVESFSFDVSYDKDNSPVSKAVNTYLKNAFFDRASDIHFDITDKELIVRYRIDGVLRVVSRVARSSAPYIIGRLKLMGGLNTTETRLPQDGAFPIVINGHTVDLRISTIPSIYGEKIVVRLLDNMSTIKDLDEVGFSDTNLEKIKRLVSSPYGMILVTGPVGSGKSTLLYTFIHHLNSVEKNLITLEDPVEYKLPGITQMAVNTAIGLTFPVGLRSVLRQDPDIVLVGEIRDEETANIAVKASNTGRLIMSTLHTNTACSSLTRLPEMGVERYNVASSLMGVINQRLVRKLCKHCKEEYISKPTDLNRSSFPSLKDKELKLFKAVGCKHCGGTGFSGRAPIHEVLVMDDDIRQMVLDGVLLKDIENSAIAKGMVTLKEDGLEKVIAGVTSLDELRRLVF